MSSWKKVLGWTVGLMFACLLVCAGLVGPCWSAWAFSGVLLRECPVGKVRPVAHARVEDVGRGVDGTIEVWVDGFYVDRSHSVGSTSVRRFTPTAGMTDDARPHPCPLRANLPPVGVRARLERRSHGAATQASVCELPQAARSEAHHPLGVLW